MKRPPASPELPGLSPDRGISHAKAHLLAEASHWLATGQVVHDRSEPMGRVLARMDAAVPRERHLEWLLSPSEGLSGLRPMDYIDADQLEPLEDLLDRMADDPDGLTGSDRESA